MASHSTMWSRDHDRAEEMGDRRVGRSGGHSRGVRAHGSVLVVIPGEGARRPGGMHIDGRSGSTACLFAIEHNGERIQIGQAPASTEEGPGR